MLRNLNSVKIKLARLLILIFGFSIHNVGQSYEPIYESIPTISLLSEDLIQGPNHKVKPDIINRGLMNHYQIDSRFGVFKANSDRGLLLRIQELNALAKIEEMNETLVMAKSVGVTTVRTAVSVARVARDPFGTIEGIGDGIERLFSRARRKLRNAYYDVKDIVVDNGDKTSKKPSKPQTSKTKKISKKALKASKSFGKKRLGITRAYRSLARDLGVDPYTDNVLLEEQMYRVANYSAAASIGSKFFIPRIPGLVSFAKDVGDLVWKKDRLDLILYNEKVLQDMGIDKSQIHKLTDNEAYTPTLQTLLVASILKLKEVHSVQTLIEYAADVENLGEAEFYTNMMALLAKYHSDRSSFQTIIRTDTIIPLLITKDSRIVAMMPVDRLRWTRSVANLFQGLQRSISSTIKQKEIWILGSISKTAELQLSRHQWIGLSQAENRLSP